MRTRCIRIQIFLLLLIHSAVLAQNPDKIPVTKRNTVMRSLMGIITRDPADDPPVFNIKSETPYLPYAGKIIRRIIVKRIDFESTVLDTTRRFQNFISNAANSLHTDTKEVIVRQNLFIKEGKPLNPYRVADNERSLRNLNFILDARILVKHTKSPDSVDLVIITRDVFSLGVSLDPQSAYQYKFGIAEANLAGLGQRIHITGLADPDRNPNFGYEAAYEKSNVMGSFIDASVGYSNINSGISIGNENEQGYFIKLSRPLFQPFTRWTGGVQLSTNYSTNVFRKPDSTFIPYKYNIQDYWAGYSFGHENMPANLPENRNRKLIAVRWYDQYFTGLPTGELTEPDRFAYRNRVAFLTQLTFFRQDFYKTQYVLGFGRTEDVPYGYRISLTSGWENETGIKRPYLGGELYYARVQPSGTILSYTFKLASYLQNKAAEDGLILLNFRRFSKIHPIARMKIRHQFDVGYAWLFDQKIKRGIDIRDVNGIIGFRPDSLVHTRRLTLGEEVTMFTPWKALGFRLAPVARIDLALINRDSPLFSATNLFAGFSAGIRARNENLIFDTIEFRTFYYPRTVEGISPVQFSFGTNIRIKYPTNLVNPPATVFN